MYLRCPGKIFLLHRNILHYYKLHPQKCKKNCIYIKNYYGHYCQMPVKYLQNLARPFLSKNSNLYYYTEKKTHWKILKLTLDLFFVALCIRLSCNYPIKMFRSLFRVCEFPQCFYHKKLIGNILIISAETKLKKSTYTKLYCIWVKKKHYANIELLSQAIGTMLNGKTFLKKTFLLNEVHSVHSINFLKRIWINGHSFSVM